MLMGTCTCWNDDAWFSIIQLYSLKYSLCAKARVPIEIYRQGQLSKKVEGNEGIGLSAAPRPLAGKTWQNPWKGRSKFWVRQVLELTLCGLEWSEPLKSQGPSLANEIIQRPALQGEPSAARWRETQEGKWPCLCVRRKEESSVTSNKEASVVEKLISFYSSSWS